MLRFHRPPRLLILLGFGLFLLPGCGTRTATVSGTVELPKELKLADTDIVQITFVPDAKGEKSCFAVFNSADKTFVCKDVTPSGKYKITVNIEPPLGLADSPKRAPEFAAFNKTFAPSSTKLVYQATDESSQSIILDLAKGTVSKK